MKIRRFGMSPNGDNCRLFAAFLERFMAVLLAQRGHETLLERRKGVFRAVIIDRRAERDDLRILTRVNNKPVFTKR